MTPPKTEAERVKELSAAINYAEEVAARWLDARITSSLTDYIEGELDKAIKSVRNKANALKSTQKKVDLSKPIAAYVVENRAKRPEERHRLFDPSELGVGASPKSYCKHTTTKPVDLFKSDDSYSQWPVKGTQCTACGKSWEV